MTGKIKWFHAQKGYGFIYGEDGCEYFFHITALADDSDYPEDGAEVEFDVEQVPKGAQAVNVKITGQKGGEDG